LQTPLPPHSPNITSELLRKAFFEWKNMEWKKYFSAQFFMHSMSL
jgi:hypothetical protein